MFSGYHAGDLLARKLQIFSAIVELPLAWLPGKGERLVCTVYHRWGMYIFIFFISNILYDSSLKGKIKEFRQVVSASFYTMCLSKILEIPSV